MKSRVVLVADADKEWRDAKLCRFVRDAEENPILTFTKWNGKTGRSRWLAIRGHQLCEVQRIDDIRSLFAPRNVVVQDGSLLVVTPMDPLFLLLEQLAHWTRNTQFCALHDIMESCGIPLHGISRWNASAISNLCDIDGSDDRLDILCVRRNDTKITAWLRKKVDRIQALGVAPTRSSSNDCTTVERFQRPPDEDTTAPTQPNTEAMTRSFSCWRADLAKNLFRSMPTTSTERCRPRFPSCQSTWTSAGLSWLWRRMGYPPPSG
ncbi:hypothetical protein, variant 3 [Aphanomyces invadans]|uniref:Rnh202 triple barrel domain-containing protein n=1 Tax=Aphanomyces invadans TaxID=157072 RepID=A0A024T9I1_9STRA|nr:hypothetical protein, variant 3 [Aphanomyces invadans]ETV90276.1 hypothetical protein, variant 3 [Aphanomyces invadans]|eukprot:XP_008881101.1 hypothetical protein, variant 3 [Aphanomyces invadans]